MDFRFFKADPEPTANVQWPAVDPDIEPTFTLMALQRAGEPDTAAADGFDYFGAYGVGDDIDAWAGGQPVTAITKNQLPNPITFYPAPFNEA